MGRLIAGERLRAGDAVAVATNGKVYRLRSPEFARHATAVRDVAEGEDAPFDPATGRFGGIGPGTSPLPWHCNGNLICTGGFGVGEIVATVGTEGGRWRPGDADLIVLAVNAHDDLVAACEEAKELVARLTPLVADDEPVFGPIAQHCDLVREHLRAALAKATAEPERAGT